jgi:hypothetical protein
MMDEFRATMLRCPTAQTDLLESTSVGWLLPDSGRMLLPCSCPIPGRMDVPRLRPVVFGLRSVVFGRFPIPVGGGLARPRSDFGPTPNRWPHSSPKVVALPREPVWFVPTVTTLSFQFSRAASSRPSEPDLRSSACALGFSNVGRVYWALCIMHIRMGVGARWGFHFRHATGPNSIPTAACLRVRGGLRRRPLIPDHFGHCGDDAACCRRPVIPAHSGVAHSGACGPTSSNT